MLETFNLQTRTRRVATASLVFALLWGFTGLVAGCKRDTELTLPKEYQEALFTKNTKRVYLVREGSSDTDVHVGWVIFNVTEKSDGDEETVTTAKDADLNDIGFYINESGSTYLYEGGGTVKKGNLEWPRALEVFYGEGEIYRVADEI